MKSCTLNSSFVHGVDPWDVFVRVEVHHADVGDTITIRGLRDGAERETRVRVRAALRAIGALPAGRIEVHVDGGTAFPTIPDGSGFDLPIALGIALASDPRGLLMIHAFGELSLTGEVRPVRGAVVRAIADVETVLCPAANAAQASHTETSRVYGVSDLAEALAFCRDEIEIAPEPVPSVCSHRDYVTRRSPDLSEVRGLAPEVLRAVEIAAVGGHGVLLVGGPGAGKTMIARRFPGLLPDLSHDEAIDVLRVHSVAGLNSGGPREARPFRAPHHTATAAGLLGGGSGAPRPGEVSLAHNGVLFLDDLPEFSRVTLDSLPRVLAEGEVTLSRAAGSVDFPARAQLVASCPCGFRGDPRRRCECSEADVERYTARIERSGILQALPIRVQIGPADPHGAPAPTSAEVRERVTAARQRLDRYLHNHDVGLPEWSARTTELSAEAEALIDAIDPEAEGRISERASRVWAIARTIAVLDGADHYHGAITAAHVTEAISLARGGPS